MQDIKFQQIEDYLSKKTLSNSQPYRSVLESFVSLSKREILKKESMSELYERFIIGKSAKSAKFAKSVIYNFCDQLNTITEKIPKIQEETPIFEGSSEQQKESLRQKQELAKIQAEQLAKTQLEAKQEALRLEEIQKKEQEEKAEIEAQKRKEAQKQRMEKLTEGFVSENIPDRYIQFNPVDYIPKFRTEYHEQDHEIQDLEFAIDNGKHVVLVGSAGTGKTEAILNYAYQTKTPVFKMGCSADARSSDLIGCKTIDSNQNIKFLAGMLTKSILAGNLYNRSILVLDEGNTLIPKIQKLINGGTDGTRFIDLPEGRLQINQGVKFIVCITMNNKYSGTSPLNVELKDRFRFVKFNKLTKTTKQKIFETYNIDQEIKDKLIDFSDEIDKMQKEDRLEQEVEFTTRSQKATLEDIENYQFLNVVNAEKRALKINFVDKFSDEIEAKKALEIVNRYF